MNFSNFISIRKIIIKKNDNEKNIKLRSIICSIFLCYYNRLSNDEMKFNFESQLRYILLKIINNEISEEYCGNLIEQIQNEELKKEIVERTEENLSIYFNDFIKIEQDFLIDQMDLDKGIVKSSSLKENIFSLFVSLITNIPLILVWKPGSGKRLCARKIF